MLFYALNKAFMAEQSQAENTTVYSFSQILSDCDVAIKNQDYSLALKLCKQFLDTYPISLNTNSEGYQNFLLLSSGMIHDNNNHEGVINLLQIKNGMVDFVNTFYLQLDKKGYHFPAPVIKAEDALFVFEFCASFDRIISQKLGK